MTAVLERLRLSLGQAGFEQRRQLMELLIDRVVVTDGQIEIRYVIPTTPNSTRTQFCHLRTDYFQIEPTDVRPPHQIEIQLQALSLDSHTANRTLVGCRSPR